MARRRYLVTGGCGFIGSHLVDRLIADGAAVRVLDDLSTGTRANLHPAAELVVGDVADRDTLRASLAGVDGCFHLAAIASVARCQADAPGAHRVNLGASVALFDLARPGALDLPVVYASSAAVYGDNSDLPLAETARPMPFAAYGADKLGCELHAHAAAVTHGLRAAGMRFFNVYGPRQDPSSPYSGVISIFLDRLARGMPITVHGDGAQSRDFIAVADVVELLARAMDRLHGPAAADGAAPVFNVCTGESTSVRGLVATLAQLAGRRPEIRWAPARSGDIRHSLGSPAYAFAHLGYRPTVPLADGLAGLFGAATEAA